MGGSRAFIYTIRTIIYLHKMENVYPYWLYLLSGKNIYYIMVTSPHDVIQSEPPTRRLESGPSVIWYTYMVILLVIYNNYNHIVARSSF